MSSLFISAVAFLMLSCSSSVGFILNINLEDEKGQTDVKVNVKFNTRFKDAEKYLLNSFVDISLAQCGMECITREACAGAEYKRSANYCILYKSPISQSSDSKILRFVNKPGFITISADEKPALCVQSACGTHETCNVTTGLCSAKECTSSTLPEVTKGNLLEIGSKVILGNNTLSEKIVCAENGQWIQADRQTPHTKTETSSNDTTTGCIYTGTSTINHYAVGDMLNITDNQGTNKTLECSYTGFWIAIGEKGCTHPYMPDAPGQYFPGDTIDISDNGLTKTVRCTDNGDWVSAIEESSNGNEGVLSCKGIIPNFPTEQYIFQTDHYGLTFLCDLYTDGGNWTVIQIRRGGVENFDKDINEYKRGFGFNTYNFWFGLRNIYALMSHSASSFELRVDLEDWDGNKAHALYDNFRLSGETDDYAIKLGNYSGTAGDGFGLLNGKSAKFSTVDVNNNPGWPESCADKYRSGWWFIVCPSSNLNGIYFGQGMHTSNAPGMGLIWAPWKGFTYSLKAVSMMVRETGSSDN